jgi:hypothetical protein
MRVPPQHPAPDPPEAMATDSDLARVVNAWPRITRPRGFEGGDWRLAQCWQLRKLMLQHSQCLIEINVPRSARHRSGLGQNSVRSLTMKSLAKACIRIILAACVVAGIASRAEAQGGQPNLLEEIREILGEPVLYATYVVPDPWTGGFRNSLYTINRETGVSSLVGRLGYDMDISSLAYDTRRHVLYGLGVGILPGLSMIFTIDRENAGLSPFGNQFSPDVPVAIFGWFRSVPLGGHLAYDEQHDVLYVGIVSPQNDPGNGLYRISIPPSILADGTQGATFIGSFDAPGGGIPFPDGLLDLGCDTKGSLWAFGYPLFDQSTLASIDKNTGNVTTEVLTSSFWRMAFEPIRNGGVAVFYNRYDDGTDTSGQVTLRNFSPANNPPALNKPVLLGVDIPSGLAFAIDSWRP